MASKTKKSIGSVGFVHGGVLKQGVVVVDYCANKDPYDDVYVKNAKMYGSDIGFKYVNCEDYEKVLTDFKKVLEPNHQFESIYVHSIAAVDNILKEVSGIKIAHNCKMKKTKDVSDDDEEEPQKEEPKKAKAKKTKEASDDEEVKKEEPKKAKAKKTKEASDDEEVKKEEPKKTKAKKTKEASDDEEVKKPKGKKAKEVKESSDESSGESEPEKVEKKPPTKVVKKAK